jgi:microsomal dipeptidase-like Zn-dependent dipeptidase
MPALTAARRRRAYTETDVRKILGGNLLRVRREVMGS